MRRTGHEESQDRKPTFRRPVLAFSDLWSCAATQAGRSPLAAPSESLHPLRVCTLPAGQITSMITLLLYNRSTSRFRSIPFRRLCRPFLNGKGSGKEWVIDKSLLDFSLLTYIYILLRWIFRRRFFRQRKCQQRQKRARHVCSCLALYRPYRAEAGVIIQTSKVVNR